MQILRFFRNAFISPSRMHTVDRCHFCFEPATTSNIGHVFECTNFTFLLHKAMPTHVAEQIAGWIPGRNHHMFLRLLLAFPKLTRSDRSLILDIFCNAAHLFNAGNHNPHLPLKEVLKTAETFFRWPSHHSFSKKTPARNPKKLTQKEKTTSASS